jgi:hypothetical protein
VGQLGKDFIAPQYTVRDADNFVVKYPEVYGLALAYGNVAWHYKLVGSSKKC